LKIDQSKMNAPTKIKSIREFAFLLTPIHWTAHTDAKITKIDD